MFINPVDAKEVEKSITLLVDEYNKSGNNPKPVILHSLNVAFYLLRQGYGKELIIAAVLHDLIEDSDVKIETIKSRFGRHIAEIVSAVSHDQNIVDREDKYKEMFGRTVAAGREATILKCADTYSNSFFIGLVKDTKLRSILIQKMKYFLDLSKPIIGKEPVWSDLENQYCSNKKQFER